jgi:hypothetical protein
MHTYVSCNSLLNIENMTEQDLQDLQKHYIHLAQLTNQRLQQGERRQQTTAGTERKNAQKKQAQEHLS